MSSRREINVFNIAFLDLISGALGAVIILYVAVPKKESEMIPVKEYEAIEKENDDLVTANTTLIAETKKLEEDVKRLEEQNKIIEDELAKAKEIMSSLASKTDEMSEKTAQEKDKKSSGIKAVGFDFKGKNIVFIIDVSGSMMEKNMIGQVSSGLRMFVTSLTEDYKIDVVFFPDGLGSTQRPLWRRLKSMDKTNKQDVYTYLQGLVPFGGTPTRAALKFALQNYPDASDIVLLSDGAPTLHNRPLRDDIDDILKEVQRLNRRDVQINTIGVGSDFSYGTRTSALYKFLEQLAEQNNGFFHSF